MAVSTCLKCAGQSFEFAPSTPIGVLDPATGAQIDALKNQIAAIDERLNRIAKALQR